MGDFDPTEFPSAVKLADQEKRRYLVYDISKTAVSSLVAALSAADQEADYLDMSLREQRASESYLPTAIILYASRTVISFEETLFSEFSIVQSYFPGVMIICITDNEDPNFIRSCYDKGVRQVLPANLTLSVTTTIMQLIATGGTFVPSHLLI